MDDKEMNSAAEALDGALGSGKGYLLIVFDKADGRGDPGHRVPIGMAASGISQAGASVLLRSLLRGIETEGSVGIEPGHA